MPEGLFFLASAHGLSRRVRRLYFLHALETMHAKCKTARAKKAEDKGNQAMTSKHQYMFIWFEHISLPKAKMISLTNQVNPNHTKE